MKQLVRLLCLIALRGAAQSPGDSLFNNTVIHSIYITFPQSNYWTLLVNNKTYDDANNSSTYIPAAVVVDGRTLDSVGIQFKGNSSYYNYPGNKKPFTLAFNQYDSNQVYDKLNAINLNNMYQDPSFMHEKLFLDFLYNKGQYAPRANYTRLYINGSYWGLYLMVERISKTFLKDRFGNKGGNLFKGDAGSSACADLRYHGTLASYYNCYTLKTNNTVNNWSDLINLTAQINNTSNAEFRDSVEKVLNTNSFIGSWAAYNLFCQFDSYPFRYKHNYYIYHNTGTNKFDWITWDVSTAFGMDIPMTIPQIENLSVLYLTPPIANGPLTMRMIADSTYKDTYLKYICSYANNDFLSSVLDPIIDSNFNRIKNWVYADTLKMYSNSDFNTNITADINVSSVDYAGLKSFITTRSANVLSELNTLGYTNCPPTVASISENSVLRNSLTLFPNPSRGIFTLECNLPEGGKVSVQVSGSAGSVLWRSEKISVVKGKNEIKLDLRQITASPGVYYLKLLTEKAHWIKKLIITE